MDKESQTCGSCSIGYNTTDRIPRILINCAHTLCSHCLTKIINTPDSRKCPFDSNAFSAAQRSLENFPLNFALLALLEVQKQNICQIHGGELTEICFQDKVKICSDCALFGKHKGHPIRKIEELTAKGIKAKKELEENLMEFEKNQLKKDQDVEKRKSRCLGKVGNKVGDIHKILKEKHPEWRKQIESLFKRNLDQSLLKEEACKALEEIDQALQNEENLGVLDRDFSPLISGLQPQDAKEEDSRGSEQILGLILSLEVFLANQAKLLKSFDLLDEKRKQEEFMIEEEIPEQKQQQEHQQLPEENLIETQQKFVLAKSLVAFGIYRGFLKIFIDDGDPVNHRIDLGKLHEVSTVCVELQRYDSLFPDSNDLNYLPQILHQLNNYTSQIVEFQPSGLTDDHALSLLKILFPRIQQLTEIEISFEKCEITNLPISFFCTDILAKATSLRYLTLRLGSSRINDLSLSPFPNSLETFKLKAEGTGIGDDGIEKIFHTIEGVKKLSLRLQRTQITDRSLKVLGNNMMSCMKNLERLTLDVSETEITMEGVNAILTGVPMNLRSLNLNFEGITLSDQVISLFEEKILPKLALVEKVYVSLGLEGTDLEAKMSKILKPIQKEAEKRKRASRSKKGNNCF